MQRRTANLAAIALCAVTGLAFALCRPVSVSARSNPEVWSFVRRCAPRPVRVYRFLGDFYAAYPGATLVRFRGEAVSMRSPSGLYELAPIDSIMVLDCDALPRVD